MDIEELYIKYRRPLFSYAYRLTRHRETAEDLTQEAFLQALKSQDTVLSFKWPFAWLKKVVYHLYTKQRDNTDALNDYITTENLSELIERENEAKMRLDKLTLEEKTMVTMVAMGKTQEEIAEQMQTYHQDISRRVKKIRKKLKKIEQNRQKVPYI